MRGTPIDFKLKVFQCRDVEEAKEYAMAGGQAIHLHRIIVNRDKAPKCFVRAVDAGEDICHLFDQDVDRLEATARACGVQVIVIEHRGTPRQHIDLCSGPLRRAVEWAEKIAAGIPIYKPKKHKPEEATPFLFSE